jgi:hypothetical protein
MNVKCGVRVAGKSLGKRHIAKVLNKGALSEGMHIINSRIGRLLRLYFLDIRMMQCVSQLPRCSCLKQIQERIQENLGLSRMHLITSAQEIEFLFGHF